MTEGRSRVIEFLKDIYSLDSFIQRAYFGFVIITIPIVSVIQTIKWFKDD